MKNSIITTIAAVLLASCGKPGDILAVSAIGDINAVKRDLLKSTLVVYMGDNGFQFGEQGLIDHLVLGLREDGQLGLADLLPRFAALAWQARYSRA